MHGLYSIGPGLKSNLENRILGPMSERIVLVTGAARGLGRAIAVGLARDSSAVVVHFRKNRRGAETTARLVRVQGAEALILRADLSREREAKLLVRRVERSFGRVDVLVNNVGPIRFKPWDGLAARDWESALRFDILTAYFCLRAVLPGMRKRRWGRVINLGYGRAEHLAAFPTILPYAAAKTSLLILTRTAAAAEAGSGITVNMVSPGLIEGGILPAGRPAGGGVALGTPDDVAAAVRFLAGEESGRITGTNVIVAGTWKM
jgi:3-oxoacyl-[acyl-carrier protein] reductase